MLNLLRPNWSAGVTETLAFRTEVNLSENGKEQMTSRRAIPRRTVNFRALFSSYSQSEANKYLRSAFGQPIACGDFSNPVGMLNTQLRRDDTTMDIIAWGNLPASVVIVDRASAYAVTSSNILPGGAYDAGYAPSFDGPPTHMVATIPPAARFMEAGSIIYGQMSGYFSSEQNFNFVTDDLVEYNVNVEEIPSTRVYSSSIQYNSGLPIIRSKPNWSGGVDFSHLTPFDEVDYSDGVIKRYRKYAHERHLRSCNFMLNRQETERIQALFVAQRGQQKSFYMPSWTKDMVLLSSLRSTSNSFSATVWIPPILTAWKGMAVTFVRQDGTSFTRKIVQVNTVENLQKADDFSLDFDDSFESSTGNRTGTFHEIIFEVPLPRDYSRHDIAMICLTPVCRFASDTLVVNWVHNDLASMKISVQTVDGS